MRDPAAQGERKPRRCETLLLVLFGETVGAPSPDRFEMRGVLVRARPSPRILPPCGSVSRFPLRGEVGSGPEKITVVIAGSDPAIHAKHLYLRPSSKDARVRPAHDETGFLVRSPSPRLRGEGRGEGQRFRFHWNGVRTKGR
jgi:hypothetical protein